MNINSTPRCGLYQFIWDCIFLSRPQTSSVISSHCHFLSCVWPHRKTSDFSLCLIRAVDSVYEATLGLIFLSTVQLPRWTLPYCSTPGAISGHATSLGNQVGNKVTWPSNFCELYPLLPPDLPHVTHHLPPPCTCTAISWFLADAMFLPASRPLHMLFLCCTGFLSTLLLFFIS